MSSQVRQANEILWGMWSDDDGDRVVRRLPALLFLFGSSISAAVTGSVLNQTTGKPQANATVTLYKLGGAGMESIESVKAGADGKFVINQPVEGPHLIQTAWDGVTYNHMLSPGSATSGVSLEVYDSAPRLNADAKVATHMVLLEPGADRMNVSESIVYQNNGKVTFNDPEGGTLRFYVASANGRIGVRATAPQGMPVERAAEKTSAAGVYKVDFPVKPGETRFDLTYSVPLTTPGTYAGKTLHGGGPVRMVAPNGVKLSGEGLNLLGQEPTTLASIYEIKSPDYSIRIEGTGTLSQPTGTGAGEEEDTGAGIRQIRPRVYDRFYFVLGLALLILFFGFLLLLRRGSPFSEADAAPAAKPSGAKGQGKGKPRG
jgi:hypothetical protein